MGQEVRFQRGLPPRDWTGVAVWGRKNNRSNLKAASAARQQGLPILRLEDGFLRSLDLGVKGAPPLALVLDRTGIYYDATGPSDLETLLASTGWETPELLAGAQKALNLIVERELSKYNQAPPAPPELLGGGGRPKILLIDQTYGDKSIELGLAGPATFQEMLAAAQTEHPEADIFIKTHPDVIAGRKKGHFDLKKNPRLKIISEDYNPLSLLKQVDQVYTVSSQMGFEALFVGKTVHCFGLPFYAGWGLTQDRRSSPRRGRPRTLLELFAAAYILYSRYLDPIQGSATDIFTVIRLLSLQKRHNEANRGRTACFGFSFWKQPHARAYVQSTGGRIRFFKNLTAAAAWAGPGRGRVVVWSGKVPLAQEDICAGLPLVRMEDGFLRSVGLGSDFNAPYSLVLDPDGIYYDPQKPSRLEKILAEYDFKAEAGLLERARLLREEIVRLKISKYNFSGDRLQFADPGSKKVILVPGQVENDASILRGCGQVDSNLKLLSAARQGHPDAFIIYKPHPDVERLNRPGRVEESEALALADVIARGVNINALWPLIDEVQTMTSLVGFEALLRGLEVTVHGGPFYAGWGLTKDRLSLPRRGRGLTLDELTAGTLILYPDYFDWTSGLFCDPEDILARLANSSAGATRGFWANGLWVFRELVKKIRPLHWVK